MENKKIILILVIIIVILAAIVSFMFLNYYKDVDSNYVAFPLPNEKVRFTGTYLGPDDSIYNFDHERGVIQVGSAYAIIGTKLVKGLEGQTITVEGHFVNDKTDATTVPINNKYVTGENFCLEKVVKAKKPAESKTKTTTSSKTESKSWVSIGSYSGSGTGSESITIPAGKIKIEFSAYPIKNYADNYLYIMSSNGESGALDWDSHSAVASKSDSITYTSSNEETFSIDYYETVSWEVKVYRYQ